MNTMIRLPDVRPLRGLGALLVLSSLVVLTGCATIMHGTTQQIGLSSSPTGAQVSVDGVQHGVTPVVADLKRKDTHLIKLALDGYEPFEIVLTRSTSGWVWGNIVFGGIIGLAVDAITGGLYKLAPEQVSAQLARSEIQMAEGGEVVLVTVLLRPEAGMERVGTLVREEDR